jgi:hypothetical protein
MSNITIRMRDGSVKEFPHKGRAGGSYTKSLRHEPGFVVITDEWYTETALPTEMIAEGLRTDPPPA